MVIDVELKPTSGELGKVPSSEQPFQQALTELPRARLSARSSLGGRQREVYVFPGTSLGLGGKGPNS